MNGTPFRAVQGAILTALPALVIGPALAGGVEVFLVSKDTNYSQIGPGSVVLSLAPGGLPFEFEARVVGDGAAGIERPILTGPICVEPDCMDGVPGDVHNDGLLCPHEEGRWVYGNLPDCEGYHVGTRSELDTQFQNGLYSIAVGAERVDLNLIGDLDPATPPFAVLKGGAWRGDEYHISFGEDLVIGPSTFAEWGAGVGEVMFIIVYHKDYSDQCQRSTLDDPGSLPDLTCTVPGGAIAGGERLQVNVEFARLSDLRPTVDGFPGAIGVAFYAADTELWVNVGPECVGDFNGDTKFDLADITGFVGAFVAMDDSADVHIDGLWDLSDLVRFVTDFNSECEG